MTDRSFIIGENGGTRATYNHLPPGEPRQYNSGEAKYELSVIIAKKLANGKANPDVEVIKAAAMAAMKAKGWDGDSRPAGLRFPFKDGDAKVIDEITGDERFANPNAWAREHYVFSARTKNPPGVVVGPDRRPAVEGDLRAGDHVIFSADMFGYQNEGAGISAGLGNVWIIKRGEEIELSKSRSADDDFAGLKPKGVEDIAPATGGDIDQFFGSGAS